MQTIVSKLFKCIFLFCFLFSFYLIFSATNVNAIDENSYLSVYDTDMLNSSIKFKKDYDVTLTKEIKLQIQKKASILLNSNQTHGVYIVSPFYKENCQMNEIYRERVRNIQLSFFEYGVPYDSIRIVSYFVSEKTYFDFIKDQNQIGFIIFKK